MDPAPCRPVPTRARQALRPAAVGVALVVGLLAGCTVGPSQRPPVAVRGENMPAPPPPTATAAPPPDTLPEPGPQRAILPFFECTEEILATSRTPPPADRTLRVGCGELATPTDPDRPDLGGATLAVLRVGLADAPEDQPPLLVLGDSAGQPTARAAVELAGQVSPALLRRYTLVGLDRRGAGADGLDCAPPAARAALVDADAAAIGEADLLALLEQARAVVHECNLALDDGIGAYRTTATAADVERLRAVLGVERLSAIGVGDGASALADWTRTAPRAVGRLVLDDPPQPGLDEPDLSESRAKSAESAFDAFAVGCTARPDCPLGADPRATVTGLIAVLRTQPSTAADGRRLTAGAAVNALLTGLGEPRDGPALAAALAAAGAGDPAPLLDVLDPVVGPGGRFDGMLATACNDTRRRLAPGEIGDLAARWHVAYPLFGAATAVRLVGCASWPTGGPAPVTGPAGGAPPILVLGTAADPRASLEGSRRAAESLATGRFVSWQGSATGAYPRTACVREVVDALLLDGVAPTSGPLCPP